MNDAEKLYSAFDKVNQKDIEKNVISIDKAIKLFDELADNQEIAFNFRWRGCYARAVLMREIMLDKSITPKLIKSYQDKEMLKVDVYNQTAQCHPLEWDSHVAPVVEVKLDNGNVESLVFDPSLFDGPVWMEDWRAIMNAEPHKIKIDVWEKTLAEDGSDPLLNKALKQMDDHLWTSASYPLRDVFSSSVRRQWAENNKKPLKPHGKTWVQQGQKI